MHSVHEPELRFNCRTHVHPKMFIVQNNHLSFSQTKKIVLPNALSIKQAMICERLVVFKSPTRTDDVEPKKIKVYVCTFETCMPCGPCIVSLCLQRSRDCMQAQCAVALSVTFCNFFYSNEVFSCFPVNMHRYCFTLTKRVSATVPLIFPFAICFVLSGFTRDDFFCKSPHVEIKFCRRNTFEEICTQTEDVTQQNLEDWNQKKKAQVAWMF